MRKPVTELGDYGVAALEQIRRSALAGERALSHAAMAAAIGCSSSVVQKQINVMLRTGMVEMRIDVRCAYRRAYWIIAENLKTEGFDVARPLDVVKEAISKAVMVAEIERLAEAGQGAPTLSDWARDLGTYPARIHCLLAELFQEGTIEVRSLAGHLRAYRVTATGQTTAGFERGRVLTPSKGKDGFHKPAFDRARAAPRERDCITCQTKFPSEGAHNRMCDGCRSTAEPETAYRVLAI